MRFIALALLVAAVQAGVADADLPAKIPVRDFFAKPTITSPKLSADGKTYAYIQSAGDLQAVLARDVGSGSEPKLLVKISEPETRLSWTEWANSNRLLLSAETRNPYSIRVRARMTRLYGIDRDGKNFDWLGRRWELYGQDQLPVMYQDQIVHWTPADDDTVLISYRPPFEISPSVMRMNVNTGALRSIQARANDIQEWHADAVGVVRAGEATTLSNLYQLFTRIAPDAPWVKVIEYPVFDKDGPTFAGFHEDSGKIYVSAPKDGREAIFEFDLRTKQVGDLVFAHPKVDVDGLQRDPGMQPRVVGARFTVDRPAIHFFDPLVSRDYRELSALFEREFGMPVFFESISESANGDQQILEVSSDIQPPVYFFYDRAKRQMGRILEERPTLKPQNLAPMKRVTYQARDGLEISAYLTVPRGVEPKNLPVVINVHGGPWARDYIHWDPEVQVLANRGFAVLQINFRGSSGFGTKHLVAGYREWGQKIQDDITDGVKWLVATGVADPDRVGIMGASYGGYATLVGLTKTPELYRAGAAYAAVTDIEFMLSDDKWYDWGLKWQETMVGGERGDKERLRQSSPLRQVTNIRVPVLLGHGVDDQTVHVRQSQRMAQALREAHKEYQYLEFPDEIHGFLLEANELKWYEALVAFFEKNLAPRAAAPAPAASKA